MDLDGFIIALGLGFLGFAIGLAIGYENTIKRCRKAFRNEGYDYSQFHEVLENEK
tara:strand:- start:278 stop:442 length:165 start_codon:yes stop_codon:yes gene_type:complete